MNSIRNDISDDNTEYDAIILGAGHNGLITQAYLGKAGLKTLSLDRRPIAGGASVTVEDTKHPGFLHNTHSFFHRGVTHLPWFKELELENHGLDYIEPELNTAVILKNGDALEWWTSLEKTVESFARFSQDDAETLVMWHDRFVPIVEQILIPESQSPPLPWAEREAMLQKTSEGRLLLETSKLSPIEFVTREFKHPTVQAGLLFFNGLREVDLRCKGFGYHIPALLASKGRPQMARGGSARLAKALIGAVEATGGKIVTNIELKRIQVESGKAVGVETADGRYYKASKLVASSLNPQQTFLELLDRKALPDDWAKKAENFEYNLLAPLFGVYLNLKEPPRYRAAENHPHLNEALMVVLGLETFEQFPEIVRHLVRHHQKGTIPKTVMWGCSPTVFDPTQAPNGMHTAFMWEKLPYALHGDPHNWDDYKDTHGDDMIKLWTEYAPNLEGAILSSFTRSAYDTFRGFPNMREGDLLVGSFANGQLGYNRPFPGAGHYRTCFDSLYLCGSSSYPGGNVTGLPGYNAAQVMLRDLKDFSG